MWIENLSENNEFIKIGVKRRSNNKIIFFADKKNPPFTNKIGLHIKQCAENLIWIFGEKSWCYGRIGPYNQDQVNENNIARKSNQLNMMLSQLLNTTKLMIIQFIKKSKYLQYSCNENWNVVERSRNMCICGHDAMSFSDSFNH